MTYLNRLGAALKPSETLAVKARATELARQGKEIIDLSCGEPDIDTPEYIKDGARKALQEGKTKYTEVAGIRDLREAIAKKLTEENKIPTDPADVVVCNGGKQALEQCFAVILEHEDEVVIPAPYWVSYPAMVEVGGGKPVIVKSRPENGFKLTAAELAKAITPRTKAIIINSPSNPTGAAYTKEELQQLATVIEPSSALVISDEIYEKVTYGGFKFCSFATACPTLASRTVTVNGFSKAYSMTGWRVGYLTGPKEIVSAVSKCQSQTTSNICSIAQYAALAALKGASDFLEPMVQSFNRRIDKALSIIEQTPGLSVARKPDGAFYLFIRFDKLQSKLKTPFKGSVDFVRYLLDEAGVAVVQGEAFGDDLAFRASVATSDANVERGFTKIRDAILKLT